MNSSNNTVGFIKDKIHYLYQNPELFCYENSI